MTTERVWAHRSGSLDQILLKDISILDTAPALITLREIMSVRQDYARNVIVSAVDVNTGEFVEFTKENTSYFDMAQAALSSSSIPGVFPP